MSTPENHTVVWIIAGSDSSGGAGIQSDLRTLQSLGVLGGSIITAITAQAPSRVSLVAPVPDEWVGAQLGSLATGLPPHAIKIGMLGSAEIVREVARFLERVDAPTVLDPVLASTSGAPLLEENAIEDLKTRLIPRVSLLTPNLPEAERLLGRRLVTDLDIELAAEEFLRMGSGAVLIKGGHRLSDHSQDYFADGKRRFWLTSRRRQGKIRGTGCALSTAAAAALAKGDSIEDAVVLAKCYLNRGIRLGSSLLFQERWPEESRQEDLPLLTPKAEIAEIRAFPDCGPDAIGFYPIVDRTSWLRRLIPLGVTTAQLRIKDLHGETLEEEIRTAVEYARETGCRLFINDYWELAIKYAAYGVHLGQEDLETADLTRLNSAGIRLGISTHSHSEVARAAALKPSYFAVGPIFPTTCKSMRFGPQGLEGLKYWNRLIPGKIVAIGGLKLERSSEVFGAGADGAAVIADVIQSAMPEERARGWVSAAK